MAEDEDEAGNEASEDGANFITRQKFSRLKVHPPPPPADSYPYVLLISTTNNRANNHAAAT